MKLLTKLIIIFLLVILMFQADYSNYEIGIIFTVALFFSAFEYYLDNNKFKIFYLISIIILSFINPIFVYIYPLAVFDTFIRKKLFYLNLIYFFVLPLIAVSLNIKIILIIFCTTNYILSIYISMYFELQKEKYNLIDNALLKEHFLYEQNQQLLHSQEQEIHLATLNERARIARDIHDNVGHILSSSIIQLGAIKKLNEDPSLNEFLDNLTISLNDGMDSIRLSVHNLDNYALSLEDEINKLIDSFIFCQVSLHYDIKEPLNKTIKVTILTIIKEALNNCSKHSNATLIKIILRDLNTHYQLIIYDNGTKQKQIDSTGIGLKNIESRVKQANGILNISNDDGFKMHIIINKEV